MDGMARYLNFHLYHSELIKVKVSSFHWRKLNIKKINLFSVCKTDNYVYVIIIYSMCSFTMLNVSSSWIASFSFTRLRFVTNFSSSFITLYYCTHMCMSTATFILYSIICTQWLVFIIIIELRPAKDIHFYKYKAAHKYEY